MKDEFCFDGNERFADVQLLRYELPNFENLTLRQKQYIYSLAQATLYGRDITFDQFGRFNLRIRRALEAVYTNQLEGRDPQQFSALEEYLKQVWFSNGIYHHYGCEKFTPRFTPEFLTRELQALGQLPGGDTLEAFQREVYPVMFNPDMLPKRVNKAAGEDLILTSACNYYEGVTQAEVEQFYAQKKAGDSTDEAPSWGLNSTLVKDCEGVHEITWCKGSKYSPAIEKICQWLKTASTFAENDKQKEVIGLLVKYYETGDLHLFDQYSIAWLQEQQGEVDFINGFIEVYGDPLGLKASWEGIVEYKDQEATRRTQTISQNAQWFEDHSPVDPRFRKSKVKGVTASAICAAMLGGDEYPSSAIGINLPNADWIRARHGSKSVTISNLTHAYAMAAKGNGFKEEFIADATVRDLVERYGTATDNLHTDLHECLGHGSGQLLPGTNPDALKNYGNTIEEARADLFGLYYMADQKLLDLGLLDSPEAYKAQYYEYLLNGLLTQLVRIKPGHQIEEAHMRNRALIARWTLAHADGAVRLVVTNGKTFLEITDYVRLRQLFATLLAEIQRIKSEGDYEAAKHLVETYAVNVDPRLHQEILTRYEKLHIAPYKGFINPVMTVVKDEQGNVTDVKLDYTETFTQQMLRYGREYATL